MSKGLFSWFAGLFFLSWAVTGYCANLPDFTELAEKQSWAVVNVSTTQTVRGQSQFPNIPEDDPFYEFFRRFMPPQGPQQEYQTQSLGSGFIVSADGYILTNSHVVQAADEILVKLNDQREYKAKVIGADRRADVALIKIEAVNLPKVAIGDPPSSKSANGWWLSDRPLALIAPSLPALSVPGSYASSGNHRSVHSDGCSDQSGQFRWAAV
jgi:S1-C subfamily serine protease